MCAVDIETTGREPGFHEIIQIGIQPLDSNIRPLTDTRPFYTTIKPEYPERAEKEASSIHKLDFHDLNMAPSKWKVADLLDDWFQRLDLPFRKNLVPLAHNWAFEAGFMKHWLGLESFGHFWHVHPRDSMLFALSLNDRAAMRGEDVHFNYVGLNSLCKQLKITNENPHDALSDARAEAEVYRALLTMYLED
jgi:DNA polymerase III epsilon subunit-like protein